MESAGELYDLSFLVEMHVQTIGASGVEGAVLARLERRFNELWGGDCNEEALLYLQGLKMYISTSQSSAK